MTDESKRAALVVIGDEVLSGRTDDANLNYLARWLNAQGIQLAEARVISDDETNIINAVNELRCCFDYVFTTGGIGPTHDDITSLSIARAFGCEMAENAEARKLLEASRGGQMNEARLKMAMIPEGAELIYNRVSAAPGFRLDNVYVLAGIPAVMRAMLETLDGKLEGSQPVKSMTVTAYVGESGFAADLGQVQDTYPDTSIGSYPFYHQDEHGRSSYGAALVVRATEDATLTAAMQDIRARLTARGIRFDEGEPQPE